MKTLRNPTDLSVIVPVYNVEEYLPACIDSLLDQGGVRLEVILVNDGSSDRSGAIADRYADKDDRIRVIHRENGGASAARNTGLKFAAGEYIAFVDSDDWVKTDSLAGLYHEAARRQADAVMGNVLWVDPSRTEEHPVRSFYRPVPGEIRHIPFSGKDFFILLAKTDAYSPMAVNYIYRRTFLETIHARFEEGIMHEDELWSPVVLCSASKTVAVDIDFYCYRQREGSVMQSTGLRRRLDSLFRVTDRLTAFAAGFDFSGGDGELKNWFYVNIFKLYSRAFSLLPCIQDTSFPLPEHHLDHFWRDCPEMMPEPQKICRHYFRRAEADLKKYIDWRTSDHVASIASLLNTGKKLMLIYNVLQDEDLTWNVEDVPADWLITTDRRYFHRASAVVFHLPGLYQVLDDELEKQDGQVWVSLYLESEAQNPWVEDPEMRAAFDLWLCYRHDEKPQEHSFVRFCRKVEEKWLEEKR